MPHQSFKINSAQLRDDSGSAVIEFIGFGLLLQVPLLIVAVSLAQVQQCQFAAEAIARHSIRSYVLAGIPFAQSAQEILADFGVTELPNLQVKCLPSGDCDSANQIVTLHVQLGQATAESAMRKP